MKRCVTCKAEKPILDFSKNATKRDGLQSKCKVCAAAYRDQHKEKLSAYMADYVAKNPDKIRAYNARQRNKDPKAWRAYQRQHWEQNRASELARNKRYRKLNAEKNRARIVRYKSQNPDLVRASKATYRASKLLASPKWADAKKIQEYYFAADFLGMVTGEWYHVDHIVPLQGPKARTGQLTGVRLVCGLHCELNLQVLPGIENLSKSNRYWPDMP